MANQEFDIDRARRETPGCERVLHFNNAGAGLMPGPVLDAVTGYLRLEAEMGGYEAAECSRPKVESVYDSIGVLLGCGREEIAVIENATRAWDMAFYSIPFAPGDRILTCQSEYGSNFISFLQVARRTGVRIEVVPNDDWGQVSVQALEQMIDRRVKLIAITHVPTNGGLVNPAAEIGRVARRDGIPYLLDACQSVGQMPVRVQEIGCDMLSATGRKFLRGPRGTGFLYVRRGLVDRLEPPFLDLHAARWVAKDRFEIRGDARRFENWESYYAGKVGLGAAVSYALEWGLDNIWARVCRLSDALRTGLGGIENVRTHDLGNIKCGIVTFSIAGRSAKDIQCLLRGQKVNVGVTSVEATRLDMEERGLESIVRASVHYYNTEDEVERFCRLISQLAVQR
jgi:cysteine desulfurase/selenocysteine lyase